jgi:hypothetical protein
VKTSLLLSAAALWLVGCAASTPPAEVPEAPEAEEPEEVATPQAAEPAALPPVLPVAAPARTYAEAVADAAKAEASEVVTTLVPLVDGTPGLVWKAIAGQPKKLLFVTWTSWNGYDGKEGQLVPLGREVWATTAPQLQDFCKGLTKGAALSPEQVVRLEQLLGLPTGGGKNRFVELWANPADAFRPCPDPETSDRACGLDFPAASASVTVSAEHVTWFKDKSASSYGDKGYPWTRLGYTYDWGNPASEVGLSEYVLRQGAEVEVKAVSTNEVYCK